MYETHFGLSGPPFQLNPDPAFYFDSRGHSNALAYLKFGVYQGEGFIVVTGDIGAGKTTLVRTLLGGLNPEQVVAAQVVSTQLESGDLLRSIITAFGVPPMGASKAHLIATIEAFLTALAARGRRALLVVDEAQNLNREAIEELRMLSNFQLGKQALLQSFLVGQPELRKVLESKSMEQFRQRVIASCHLGPLDPQETRAYIQHRLRRVGWKDLPRIEEPAYAEIHEWTGGVPRRINLLCNRLLLAAYLANATVITRDDVERVAQEMRGEVGESKLAPLPAGRGRADTTAEASAAPAPRPPGAGRTGWPAGEAGGIVRRATSPLGKGAACIACFVDSPSAYLKGLVVAQTLAAYPEIPPVVVINPGAEAQVMTPWSPQKAGLSAVMEFHLGAQASAGFLPMSADLGRRLHEVLQELNPVAALALGQSDAILSCVLGAVKSSVPVLRLEAGRRHADAPAAEATNEGLLDRLCEVLYTSRLTAHYTLYREGIASDRVHCIGGLVLNVLHVVRPLAVPARNTLVSMAAPRALLGPQPTYVLVTAQCDADGQLPAGVAEFAGSTGLLRGVAPVIWAMSEATSVAMRTSGLEARLRSAMVTVLPDPGPLEMLGLVQAAACLVTTPEGAWAEEADALGIRVVVLTGPSTAARIDDGSGAVAAHGAEQAVSLIQEGVDGRPEQSPQAQDEYWDGGAAARLADHLRTWLPRHARAIDPAGVRQATDA